tara:strand:- start:323 stop:895 length:573 start_codon:yes stop_codon:yes gene_type:complete
MINDVSELVIEASRISGRSDLASYAPMLLGMLERGLNSALRTDAMLASTALTTDAAGAVDLPTDYLEAVSLTYGTDKVHLRRLTRQMIDTGLQGYYIAADDIVSSKTGTEHTLTYYQSIPGLWVNSTNWLLTAYPDVYLRGLVFEAFKDANDAEGAVSAKVLFDMALADVRGDDVKARRIDTVAMPRTQI